MASNTHSNGGHGYIIVAFYYFTKFGEAIPTYNNNGKTTALFFFNHVIARLGVPQAIVMDHGKYFHNHMIFKLFS